MDIELINYAKGLEAQLTKEKDRLAELRLAVIDKNKRILNQRRELGQLNEKYREVIEAMESAVMRGGL